MTATDEERAFLRRICETPEEDAVRLVYADWLDENGQPERAEFIRVQCEIERSPSFAAPGVCPLRRREGELWNFGSPDHWAVGADAFPFEHVIRCIDAETISKVNSAGYDPIVIYRRGFPDQLTCTAEDWLTHADAIAAAHPVTKVTLTGGQVPWSRHTVQDGTAEYYLLRGLGPTMRRGKTVRMPLIGVLHTQIIRAVLEAEWDKITFDLPQQNDFILTG